MVMDTLQTLLADMKSATRVTERKGAAERLLDYLNNDIDDICQKLDFNSVNPEKKASADKMTWTRLFVEVRDYFVKETEKGSLAHNNQIFFFSIVDQVFQKATSNRPWLQWSKIFDFITTHLQKERHAVMYGPSLISMLEHFLSIELYATVIDAGSWIDLITILVRCYKRYNISAASTLRCLHKCIDQGSLHSKVISTLRSDVVNFYVKVIHDDRNIIRHDILPYLLGVTSLCENNAVEFRGILCKLGEKIIPQILHINSFSDEEETALLNYLLIQYRLHMPCDVKMNSFAFYADDASKWLEILKLIYSYCIDTIEETVQKRSTRNKMNNMQLNDRFLLLASKVTKQVSSISNNESESSEDIDGVHSKKKMRYKSFHTIISDVYRKPASESLTVWMSYLTAVLNDFPELILSRTNLQNLIHLGSSLFNTTFMIRKESYQYFLSLLNAEQYLVKQGVVNMPSETWNTVWELTIKSIPVSDNKQEAINLLRRILTTVRPANITSLLSLYTNNSMPLVKSSVQLLAEYLSLCSLPIQMSSFNFTTHTLLMAEEIAVASCPRRTLLGWLMKVANANEDVSGNERLLAAVMCSLIVQQSHALLQEEIELHNPTRDGCMDFEKTLLRCCFVQLENEEQSKQGIVPESKKSCFRFIVESRVAERLVEAFQMDHNEMPKLSVSPNVQFVFRKFVRKLSLYMNVLNLMEKHSVGESGSSQTCGFRSSMERLFDEGMTMFCDFVVECFTSRIAQSAEQVEMLVKSIRIIFSNDHFCDKVNTMLSKKISENNQVTEHLKKVFRSNLARYVDRAINNPHEVTMFFDDELPSRLRLMQVSNGVELDLITRVDRKCERASMEALNALIAYGLICHHRQDFFTEIMKDLIAESFCSANEFLFDACAVLISKVSKIVTSPGLNDLIDSIIGMLQKCCRGFFQLPHCTEKLWTLFRETTRIVAPLETGQTRNHFMILVGTLYNLMQTKSSSATVATNRIHKKAFEVFTELAKFDTSLSWSEFTPMRCSAVWVLEGLHEFIDSESHLVRLYAADTICAMYQHAAPCDYSEGISSSQEQLSLDSPGISYLDRRKAFLDVLFNKLLNIFDVDTGLSSEANAQEAVNRTCIVLSCLTRLIFAFPYLQKQNVMQLFVMVKVKNIDVTLAQRALLCASPTSAKTMCCYLSYVLKKSLKLKCTAEDLPYQFFGCESTNAFLSKFRNEICVEYFELDKIKELESFAQRFNLSVPDLIRQCYGLIMARLTPGLATHKSTQQIPEVNIAHFNATHKRLIIALGGKDATDTLMVTCLGDVLLNLISLTFEQSITTVWNCMDIKLAEPVPPYYSQSTIEKCLTFLKTHSPHNTVNVIGYLAKTSPQSIYKILLALTIRIHNAHDELEKFWRMHQFSFFVNLLLKEPREIFLTMKEYVCSFVFSTYLRLLKIEVGNDAQRIRFQKVVILLITQLVEQLTQEHADEIIIFFNSVTRGIVSAVEKSQELMEPTKRLLDFLLKKHGSTFASCIEVMDPFPSDVMEFHEYHLIQEKKKYGSRRNDWPLQKEIQKCLQEIDDEAICCTRERLKFLRELLSDKKRELERMVRNLENKRFSEECSKDPIHNVIQMLIGVTLLSRDEDVTLEACRCLGEIGPIDMSVLVLPSGKNHGQINDMGDALLELVKIISGYLVSDDIRLVTASGKVLRALFEYDECSDVLQAGVIGTRLFKVLIPFHSSPNPVKRPSVQKVDANALEMKLGLNEMDESMDYRSWVVQLTKGIIECFKSNSSLASHLLPLCELKVDFCENVLPMVVYMCLDGGKTNPLVRRIVGSYFRNFINKFTSNLLTAQESSRSFTPSSSGSSTACIFMNKLALRSVLRVIQFLRRHPLPKEVKGNVKLTPWDSNFWLELNYLDIARAGQYCGAYLTSILYTEIAATEIDLSGSQYSDGATDEDSQEGIFSQGASMYPRNRVEASKIEKLLLKAYTSIGEADAPYGCGSARFADTQSSMHHLEHTMDWHRLLTLANGSSDDSNTFQEQSTALSLKQLGLYNVLWTFLKGIETRDSIIQDDLGQIQFECGWRLTKWNLNTDKPAYIKNIVESPSHSAFQMCIYDGIRTGLINDTQNHMNAVGNGFSTVLSDLRHASLESSENIYNFMSRFQMLRILEDFFGKNNNMEQGVESFIRKWKLQDRVPASDFKYQEPILFLRNVLLRAFDANSTRANLESQISESLLELTAKAREAGRLDFADSCATTLASISSKPSVQWEFEVAMNNWARGKGDVARHIMSKLIKKSTHEDELYPSLLLLYGEWLSLSHCERPSVILEKYLQRSCSIFDKRQAAPHQEVSKAHIVLAKYADAQYQNVTKYIGSDVFIAKLNHFERARMEEEQMRHSVDQDSRRSVLIMKKQSNYDSEEINCIYNERKKFLLLALRHYLRGLKASTEQDLLIFRAISLWLENGEVDDEKLVEETTRIFKDERMPTYKYIVVLHQLSARLSSKNSMVNNVLTDILVKCAEDHPYHSLPVLLTQASLHKDENLPRKNSSLKVQLTGRVQAAAQIVESLKTNKRLQKLVSRMETMWVALITLANIQDGRSNTMDDGKSLPNDIIKYLVNLEAVAVPTTTIPVLPSGNYTESVIGIKEFGKTYGLVGGINSPKKITCRGCNGIKYNMLLKGQDDLRQDAVMQQVFGVMNKLLQAEPKTWARRLHIRMYKVIPLSQRTGLIEWVENTQTLGDYLVGSTNNPGAHERYRPTDYKPIECRKLMLEAKNCGDAERKYATYMSICEHFKPVFRHFFFENFTEAGAFFEKRLAYTRSVATTSIVGYILGLGDRHVLNILMDKTTAEFIHIDLGVAFEQGRILPTPETVPFRLTRDVIDGMGISGVEGVFRKSCEMTMEVLRNNSEIILTVLQVLLYDPLYMWALTTDRVAKVQPSDTSRGGRKSKTNVEPAEDSVKERNNSAARVLLRLKQKLMGIEEEGGASGAISSGSSLSIDGHVSLLIQRAVDPEKLCRLFPGWQPYL